MTLGRDNVLRHESFAANAAMFTLGQTGGGTSRINRLVDHFGVTLGRNHRAGRQDLRTERTYGIAAVTRGGAGGIHLVLEGGATVGTHVIGAVMHFDTCDLTHVFRLRNAQRTHVIQTVLEARIHFDFGHTVHEREGRQIGPVTTGTTVVTERIVADDGGVFIAFGRVDLEDHFAVGAVGIAHHRTIQVDVGVTCEIGSRFVHLGIRVHSIRHFDIGIILANRLTHKINHGIPLIFVIDGIHVFGVDQFGRLDIHFLCILAACAKNDEMEIARADSRQLFRREGVEEQTVLTAHQFIVAGDHIFPRHTAIRLITEQLNTLRCREINIDIIFDRHRQVCAGRNVFEHFAAHPETGPVGIQTNTVLVRTGNLRHCHRTCAALCTKHVASGEHTVFGVKPRIGFDVDLFALLQHLAAGSTDDIARRAEHFYRFEVILMFEHILVHGLYHSIVDDLFGTIGCHVIDFHTRQFIQAEIHFDAHSVAAVQTVGNARFDKHGGHTVFKLCHAGRLPLESARAVAVIQRVDRQGGIFEARFGIQLQHDRLVLGEIVDQRFAAGHLEVLITIEVGTAFQDLIIHIVTEIARDIGIIVAQRFFFEIVIRISRIVADMDTFGVHDAQRLNIHAARRGTAVQADQFLRNIQTAVLIHRQLLCRKRAHKQRRLFRFDAVFAHEQVIPVQIVLVARYPAVIQLITEGLVA